MARHSLLLSSEADPDAALAVLEEAEEDRGVPLIAPEFHQDFGCRLMRAKRSLTTFFNQGKSQLLPRPPRRWVEVRQYRISSLIYTGEWQVQKSLQFGEFYLSLVSLRTHLPLYIDSVSELTSSWLKPMSPPPLVPGPTSLWSSKEWGKQGWCRIPNRTFSCCIPGTHAK